MSRWLFLLTTTGNPTLSLGEPWDSLFRAAGATVIIILVALWSKKLYLPGVVEDRDNQIAALKKQIEDDKAECKALVLAADERTEMVRAESREMTAWLRQEAIPLVAKNLDLITRMADKMQARR